MIGEERSRILKTGEAGAGPVVYWMIRDRRAADNWALLYAADTAKTQQRPLLVLVTLATSFMESNARHYDFMLKGLSETEANLREKGIDFRLVVGDPAETIQTELSNLDPALLVLDFYPLREPIRWHKAGIAAAKCPVVQVDAHNVVPVWVASDKREYGAYTIRKKIQTKLPVFLTDFPELEPFDSKVTSKPVDWEKVRSSLTLDESVPAVEGILPGETAAQTRLRQFIKLKLKRYNERNDPNAEAVSGLSPFFHFGQLAPQRAAWEAQKASADEEQKGEFLEELIVRRELSDNYCFYNAGYDDLKTAPDWAQTTLAEHENDPREYLYSLAELESAKTYDRYWNAAQMQLKRSGSIHGYMRMYWGKKILEWSESPAEAWRRAVYLNDKYALDGNDPNGYTGVAWCIAGIHDRAFKEREIFGKVRYMAASGCKRKFDIEAYCRRWLDCEKELF